MPDNTDAQPQATLKYERVDNLISAYANNAYFEASAWDLKIIFGQLDQSSGGAIVKQNIAITIPWAQAKLALFWLKMQVLTMEEQTGKIPIRKDLIPPELPPLTDEQKNDPTAQKFYEMYTNARELFIASL